MSPALFYLLGIGITAFLLYLIMNSLDEEKHTILKLMLMMGILSLLLVLPKSFNEAQTTCAPVVTKTVDTYVYGNNLTAYHWDSYTSASTPNPPAANDIFLFHKNTTLEYDSFCYTEESTTPTTYMKIIFWLYRALVLYVIVYLFVLSMRAIWEMRKVKVGNK